jgi:hypothetical protein
VIHTTEWKDHHPTFQREMMMDLQEVQISEMLNAATIVLPITMALLSLYRITIVHVMEGLIVQGTLVGEMTASQILTDHRNLIYSTLLLRTIAEAMLNDQGTSQIEESPSSMNHSCRPPEVIKKIHLIPT